MSLQYKIYYLDKPDSQISQLSVVVLFFGGGVGGNTKSLFAIDFSVIVKVAYSTEILQVFMNEVSLGWFPTLVLRYILFIFEVSLNY